MTRTLNMGGTANFGFAENVNGFVVALTGTFQGGAFAKVNSANREGDTTTGDMEHVFVHQDGSMIFTRDKGTWIHHPAEPRVLASTEYRVVRATGQFEGLKGGFRSWGSYNSETGEGVLRFQGTLGDRWTSGSAPAAEPARLRRDPIGCRHPIG